ncbi:hypothetical protein P7C70_g1968, partial [Phenoliferia sp. Uapishka_3]
MTTVSTGNFAVGDPLREARESDKQLEEDFAHSPPVYEGSGEARPPKPSFAEYLYHAKLRREVEDADKSVVTSKGIAQLFKKKEEKEDKGEKDDSVVIQEGPTQPQHDDDLEGLTETQREYLNARRALRQAGWATVFYLITCDILGPFNAPYAIASIGLVPGILLYILFGAVAALTGAMLWRLFLRMDSVRYPIKTYGDLAERIFGLWARHLCTLLQSVQLVLNVGLICLTNGQSLYQVTKSHLCFSVSVVIWAIVGMFLGQIRGLQNFGAIANASVWLNLLIIFLSMGFIAHSPPNYASAFASYGITEGPIIVQAVVSQPVFSQVNGVFNMVFAGLVAAMCIFQFTYTFPPALMLGLDMCIDAAALDEPFTTPGQAPRRADSWKNLSRWRRGYFGGGRKRVAIKFANTFFLLGGLATAGLGLWATGTDLQESIAEGAATSFGCVANV